MPPNRKLRHWKEGRSAFELGRIWMEKGEPNVPNELIRLLDSHDGTRGTVIRSGITEHETVLPFGNRGPRCHDLALHAIHNTSVITICIEAKADESFGGTVQQELLNARQRTSRTKFPDRLNWLTYSLLGIPAFIDEGYSALAGPISNLPYQLLAATAGTLLEAKLQNAAKAILVVHEFRTALTTDSKIAANAAALNRFLGVLLESNGVPVSGFHLEPGKLFGPALIIQRDVAGQKQIPSHIPLFVGKVKTNRLASVKAG